MPGRQRRALHLMVPAILVFICIGTCSVSNSPFSVHLVAVMGPFGYFARRFAFAGAPLLLGFVLGPMLEEHFRRAMPISRGSFSGFVERPVSATILTLTLGLLVRGIWSGIRDRQRVQVFKSSS